jgi:hypothetical protein
MMPKFDPPLDIPHDEEFEWVNQWAGTDAPTQQPEPPTSAENAQQAAIDALHDPQLAEETDAVEGAVVTPVQTTAEMPQEATIEASTEAPAEIESPTPATDAAAERVSGVYLSMRGGEVARWTTFLRNGESPQDTAATETPAHAQPVAPAASIEPTAETPAQAEPQAESLAPAVAEEAPTQQQAAPSAGTAPEVPVPAEAAATIESLAIPAQEGQAPSEPAKPIVIPIAISEVVEVANAPAIAADQLERDIADIIAVRDALLAETPTWAMLERARWNLRQAWSRVFR